MIYLVVVIGALTGLFLFERSKRRTAEALNTNNKTKEEVADIQKNVDVNNAEIKAEEQKRADAQKAADEEKAKNATNDDLIDFFNKPSNDNK